jgi:DeoR family transcriptional regulator of aga operon
MIEQAKRVIVIADSSKIGRVAFARMCTLAQVDELITNRSGADRAAVRKLTDVGVRVTFV